MRSDRLADDGGDVVAVKGVVPEVPEAVAKFGAAGVKRMPRLADEFAEPRRHAID